MLDGFKTPISIDNLYTNNYSSKIDSNMKMYLDKLYNIISLEISSVEEFNKKVSELENEINKDQKLKNEQLIVLYSGTNTAKSSNEYWTNNLSKWELLRNASASKPKPVKKSHIGHADVAGAIGGAAGAWVVNVLPGAGQVAYGGAIIGGAVAGSVGQAALEFMDWMGW